jgi:RecA-family ATPase
MELNNGNPSRSRWYDWLSQTIENHKGLDVLMLDPKSRFYGLVENDNDHNTQWAAGLEALAFTYKLTILFSHHVSKERSKEMSQHMSRGGSGLVDACRWVLGITGMNEKTAEKYDVDCKKFIEMDLVKSNYTAKLQHPLYFERDEVGLLHHRELGQDRISAMADKLVELLSRKTFNLTRHELNKEENGKDIYKTMKEVFPTFTRRKDTDFCLDYGLEKGWIKEKLIDSNKIKKTVFEVANVAR